MNKLINLKTTSVLFSARMVISFIKNQKTCMQAENEEPFNPSSYDLIYSIASKNIRELNSFVLNNPFIEKTRLAKIQKAFSRSDLDTDCVLSAASVFSALCGIEKTERVFSNYITEWNLKTRPVSIYSLPSGKDFSISYVGCFDGLVFIQHLKTKPKISVEDAIKNGTLSINPKLLAEALESTRSEIDNALASLTEKTDETVLEKIEQALKTVRYGFNARIIENLKKEIEENKPKVSKTKSFCYFCVIRGSLHIAPYHAFILEQSEEGIRLYQSWIFKTTLAADMKKRKLPFSEEELYYFFEKLKKNYGGTEKDEEAQDLVFGYDILKEPMCTYNSYTNTLTSLSFKYFTVDFDPSLVQSNLEKIKKISTAA